MNQGCSVTSDLYWLIATLGVTAVMPFPYVLNRVFVRGVWGALRNPAPDDLPLAAWAQRAQRAHYNSIENLVVFVPAVLAVHLLQRSSAITTAACELYFVARILHYTVYAGGIPVLRTLAFFGGWVATAILILCAAGAL
jgi:uncharacterized MAPEG superfamily protein